MTSEPRTCGDCGAKPGEPHSDGCDVARCLVTGFQRIQCDKDHWCRDSVWSGEWPGHTAGYELVVRRELAGKSLACWCPLPAEGEPDICHAAVLLEVASGEAGQ